MPLTVGGGVRQVADIRKLLLAGADKVSINTAAVKNPDFVAEAADKFGNQCIVVAIDAKKVSAPGEADRWEIFTHGGRKRTGIDAVEFARQGGRPRRRRDPAHLDGPRRHQDRLRHRADPRRGRCGARAGHRLGRRRQRSTIMVEGIRDGHATAVLAASIFHFGTYTIARGQGATWPKQACRCGSTPLAEQPDGA